MPGAELGTIGLQFVFPDPKGSPAQYAVSVDRTSRIAHAFSSRVLPTPKKDASPTVRLRQRQVLARIETDQDQAESQRLSPGCHSTSCISFLSRRDKERFGLTWQTQTDGDFLGWHVRSRPTLSASGIRLVPRNPPPRALSRRSGCDRVGRQIALTLEELPVVGQPEPGSDGPLGAN